MAARKRTASARRRLPAEEARARILEAAERKLSEVGPEGLRLTDLAAALGISHPAILHHFGSREELIIAVITRATARLNARLTDAIESGAHGHAALLEMIAEYYGAEGNARLIAWLVLSGRSPRARPLSPLLDRSWGERAAWFADPDGHVVAVAHTDPAAA